MKSLSSKQDTGFTGVVPVEPNSSKPSKFNLAKVKENVPASHPGRKGRKIVDNTTGGKSLEKSESTRARGKKHNVNADDVDKLLENDAAALLNMRKDIQIAQEKETVKARAYLASLQKESNVLKISNDAQSKQYAELIDTRATLESYIKEGEENASACYRVIEEKNANLKDVEEEMGAEGRTREMMAFMKHRLEQEISSIKSVSHELSQQLEQVRSEFAGVESAVRIVRVELASEEKHVETLHKAVRERSEQRVAKMQQLQSLVNDGEISLVRAQENMVSSMSSKMHTRYPVIINFSPL